MTRRTSVITLIVAVLAIAAMLLPASADPRSAITILKSYELETENVSNPDLANWQSNYGSGDRLMCDNKLPSGHNGQCAFRFKGSADEQSKLKQGAYNIALLNETLVYTPGSIDLKFRYYSASAASRLKATVRVVYLPEGSDTPVVAQRSVIVTGKSKSGGVVTWVERGIESPVVVPQRSTIRSLTVTFSNSSTAGMLFIEDVNALYYTN